MNTIIDQAKFCEALCSRLTDRIELHESKRKHEKHEWHAGVYDVSAKGASKTQLQRDVIMLRSELNLLSRMLND